MGLWFLFLGLCIGVLVRCIHTLYRNYVSARKTGLRFIVSPITPYTVAWQVATALLRPVLVKFRWFRAIDWTCAWQDGNSLHEELGSCFIVVSPGLNVLCSSDSRTIVNVLRRWREFVKPDNVNEIIGLFGQNVDTSNGDDWPRHRKLTAPCFSERASTSVWNEARHQTSALVTQWLSAPNHKINTLFADTGTLALNVVSAIAFENHQTTQPAKGHSLSLHDALTTIMGSSLAPALEALPHWLKSEKFLPKQVTHVIAATGEFSTYMDALISRERTKPAAASDAKLNLIGTLIRASGEKDGEMNARLSDEEVRGNVFNFIIGGLEPTAIALSYALALLAVHGDVQEWVLEEIDEVLGEGGDSYKDVYPRLKRCLAVMYETLRLFAPSPPPPRSFATPSSPHEIPTSSPTHPSLTLPPNTQIMLNPWSTHASASHFSSPSTWDPRRWLDASGNLVHSAGFFAWGSGPRICPGMKFSQVQFCAVLAGVLARVQLVVGPQEKEGILGVLMDSGAEPLVLKVRRPGELWVGVEERVRGA
ncbi:cytochrome P450 [Ophiobolus disseminans]|uniref:Cytochrome P450 n=1 Tax=Ophiobolus disseminans TaxID=1469910 RepID=A0A6A7AEQ0_9PLEO|nr:cytochrome P450 [Ophiobolus disseminans]